MIQKLFPTSLVGSYPQPDWLIDRAKLAGRFPPRVRSKELWRVAPEWLEEAQDDATILAIRDQECAGLDIITDGEMRRESYSNRFATALDGVDIDNPGTDRKSTRLNSSHRCISYAVFCLKKKKNIQNRLNMIFHNYFGTITKKLIMN